jgi:hypothetical protein
MELLGSLGHGRHLGWLRPLELMFFSPICKPTCSHLPRVIFMVDLYSRTYNIYIYRERERKRERLIYRTTRTDQGSGRRLIVTSHLVSPIRLDNIGEHHNEYVFRGKNPSIRGFERAPLGSEFC